MLLDTFQNINLLALRIVTLTLLLLYIKYIDALILYYNYSTKKLFAGYLLPATRRLTECSPLYSIVIAFSTLLHFNGLLRSNYYNCSPLEAD